MKLGVVGLPNVGKSTLFNAITNAGAASANYPFCTIEPNVGVVDVPDGRLYKLAALYDCKKIVHTSLEFVDIAGLVKGAASGEGLGNKFLSHIREVDAIVHVVRCFEDGNITHVDGSVNPLRDIEVINTELILADIETTERRMAAAKNAMKSGDKKHIADYQFLEKIYNTLAAGRPARSAVSGDEEKEALNSLFLLTSKPVVYAANISEAEAARGMLGSAPAAGESGYIDQVKKQAAAEGAEAIVLCAKIEEDLAGMDAKEKSDFLKELGINISGLELLVSACYKLLGLISFLTAGEKETRAWTVVKGTKAPGAAGKIHSDFEKGFIRAEVVDYNILVELGSFNAAKEKGKVRSEGKDYTVKDGDVILFRFNV